MLIIIFKSSFFLLFGINIATPSKNISLYKAESLICLNLTSSEKSNSNFQSNADYMTLKKDHNISCINISIFINLKTF